MGFNNGYESGYDDAKAESTQKIKALEARIAELEAGGGSSPMSPGLPAVTTPTISFYGEGSPIAIGVQDGDTILAFDAKIHGEQMDFQALTEYLSISDYDGIQLSSDVWSESSNLTIYAGDSYDFRIIWKAAVDASIDSSLARVAVIEGITAPTDAPPPGE